MAKEIRTIPTVGAVRGRVTAPPSKSVTQRALVAAALARGRSRLHNPLLSDDPLHLIGGLNALGIEARVGGPARQPWVEVEGQGGIVPAERAEIAVGNAGTAMRFLTAVAALGKGSYVLDGDAHMRRRPIEDLLAALRHLGGTAAAVRGHGCPPVRVGGGLRGGGAFLRGSTSSQYLSALLLAAPAMPEGARIAVEGELVSRPYVDLTIDVMRRFGVEVVRDPPGPEARRFSVAPRSAYAPRRFVVEGDYSSASYFFAAAAATGGRVLVDGLSADSLQGDARFVWLLRQMGCRVEAGSEFVAVEADGPLHGIEADCGTMPDIVPTLAILALFADGPTRISGVPHLKHKETDRIAALVAEIRRLGGDADPLPDGLSIRPRPLRGATIKTYDDHRMAMSFAVAGLRVPGIAISDPACVRKSFPDFWSLFDDLIAQSAG